jgi:tRNA A37 threonylcarbamoyladenosine dehydratase
MDTAYLDRFGAVGRLVGADALLRLSRSHVAVVGIGGVGSWAVEALVRSGVGTITMVDLDDVCVTNTNRQVHAVDGNVGRSKVEAMADRIRAIHPACDVRIEHRWLNDESAEAIFAGGFDAVIDAIDRVRPNCRLIIECRARRVALVTCGGAGGKRDPRQIVVDDLSRSHHDLLLFAVRKKLRKEFGFSRDTRRRFGVECVYSPEQPMYPGRDGEICDAPVEDGPMRLDCRTGFGSSVMVTATFGMLAAARAVEAMLGRVPSGDAA